MLKRFAFLAAFILFTVNIFAQNNAKQNSPNIKSITLNEAVVLALKNNVSIKREEISLEAAKRASAHSWNSILPSISVSANDEIELPDLNKRATNAVTGVQNNVGVEGRVALSMSSDFFVSIKKAKLDYESACISFEQAVSEITSQIKETYFSLILAKQNLDFMKENLKPEEIETLRSIIDAMKDVDTLVHGDFHPGNIMLQNGELMLIDMGEVTRGVPIYDVASVFRDLISAPKSNPDICRTSIGLEPELAPEIGTKFIAMYTGITDPQALEGYMQQLGLVYAFNVVMLLPSVTQQDVRAPIIINNLLRPVVIPNAEALKHILSQ